LFLTIGCGAPILIQVPVQVQVKIGGRTVPQERLP
jgi:hypothetical protein